MSELIVPSTTALATPYEPTKTREIQAKADAIIAFAAKVKEWPLVEEAIDNKIADQKQFVEWWDEKIGINHGGDRTKNAAGHTWSVAVAEELTGITQPQVSRWRKGLLAPDKYRDKLIKAARRKAELEPRVPPVEREDPVLPDGVFSTIVIDPPWPMEKIDRDERLNQHGFDYPTMTEKQLEEFEPVKVMAGPDCHLFCWTTHKFLPMTLSLLPKWGFRYVFTGVWHKPGGFQPFGLPQYDCEFWVYGRKGSPKFVETKAFGTCYSWPRREHSRKPDEFYNLIRRVTAEPRVDVFSREEREGFKQYGNETEKFA